MDKRRILVTGATGQQGGSVIAALLDKGCELYGLTRHPSSERALELKAMGVKVVAGNLSDPYFHSLRKVFKMVDSVFLVGTPFETGVEGEVLQGLNTIDLAKETGIKHLVYTSVADADKQTGIPHFDSKFKVEQHLIQSGVPFTIIAPVFFYDNMMAPFTLPGLQHGQLAQALPANIPLEGISVKNIGEFAGLILENPERFLGKRINIAGDELDGNRWAEVLSAASNKQIGYSEIPVEMLEQSSTDMAKMYRWFRSVGYDVNVNQLKREYPEIHWDSLAEWASQQDWKVLETAEANI